MSHYTKTVLPSGESMRSNGRLGECWFDQSVRELSPVFDLPERVGDGG